MSGALMAFLASWMMWLDHLPRDVRLRDFLLLYPLVLKLTFKLTALTGRIALNQRIDAMWCDLCPTVAEGYAKFMEVFQAELEANADKLTLWVASLPMGDGLLFEQLLNATLVFGQRCQNEMNQSEPLQLISSMMHFANIVLRKVSAEPVPAAIMLEVEGAQ